MENKESNFDALQELSKPKENDLEKILDSKYCQSNGDEVIKSESEETLKPENLSQIPQTNKNINSGNDPIFSFAKSQSSGKNSLGRKIQRTIDTQYQSNSEESKKDKEDFSISNKVESSLKDIPLEEVDYSQKEKNYIRSPKIKKPREDELMHFFDYQTELLNKILKQYGSSSQLSSQKIITLFELLPFKTFKKRTLSYIFSYMEPENKKTIEEEKTKGKSCFNYLMNLTFKEAYANYLCNCNVFIDEKMIYILEL